MSVNFTPKYNIIYDNIILYFEVFFEERRIILSLYKLSDIMIVSHSEPSVRGWNLT